VVGAGAASTRPASVVPAKPSTLPGTTSAQPMSSGTRN
jgi:hypothetical protein